MKNAIITAVMAATILIAGCGKKSSSSFTTATPARTDTASPSTVAQVDKVPGLNLKLDGVPVSIVLNIYKDITKTELVLASDVRDLHGITIRTEKPVTKDEAAKMIDQALLNQAGIVITHLDSKRTSVTYNDKLELHQ